MKLKANLNYFHKPIDKAILMIYNNISKVNLINGGDFIETYAQTRSEVDYIINNVSPEELKEIHTMLFYSKYNHKRIKENLKESDDEYGSLREIN